MPTTDGVPQWQQVPIISGRTASTLLHAEPGRMEVSLDLGRSRQAVLVEQDAIVLPDGNRVGKELLRAEFSEPQDCLRLDGGCPRKVYRYSEREHRWCKLYQPFEGMAPTIVINGMTMHAITRTDPWSDAEDKVGAVPQRTGRALDTCCGLGYSAQLLAQRYERVVSCEVDRNVLEVASVNPWSRGLFCTERLRIYPGDMRYLLAEYEEESLACIFHDPPTIYQAGELYAAVLYRRFAELLQRGGVLYHYVGTPGGRMGHAYAQGVIQRLQESGFEGVRRAYGGVVAEKSRRH